MNESHRLRQGRQIVVFDSLGRVWTRLRFQVVPGRIRWVLDLFARLLKLFERGVYLLDEWLRFRTGQSRVTLAAKALLGPLVRAAAYIVRLYVMLLLAHCERGGLMTDHGADRYPDAELLREYFAHTSGALEPEAGALAALAGGELTEEATTALEAALGAATVAAAREEAASLSSAWDSPADLRAAHPQAGRRWRRWGPALIGAAAIAAAAVVVVRVGWPGRADPGAHHEPDIRIKGADSDSAIAWSLHAGIVRDGAGFRFASGGRVEAGDSLGFFYSSAEPGHLAIVYADRRDVVRLLPRDGEGGAWVGPGHETRIEAGVQLTPGEGCEWVVGVMTRSPLDAGAVAHDVAAMVNGREGCTLAPGRLAGASYQVMVIRR